MEMELNTLTLRSHAKINLYLSVLHKRPDGYHEIETLMQTVDLTDTLKFTPEAEEVTLTCSNPDVPLDQSNLVYKAVALMRRVYGKTAGLRVHIEKNIPVAAGLAGGSGNAAMTLHALNGLWRLGLTDAELMARAGELGSDVPFCLRGGMAIGRGRGERLEWVDFTPDACFVLVHPPQAVSSAWAYQQLKMGLTNSSSSINLGVSVFRGTGYNDLAKQLRNDLETPVRAAFPVIDRIYAAFHAAGVYSVLMSGSGPTVFGMVPDRSTAEQVAACMRAHGDSSWRVFVTAPSEPYKEIPFQLEIGA
jgi:4-diphosphocytidyl-2-C-methyl-D-erythritol kinase